MTWCVLQAADVDDPVVTYVLAPLDVLALLVWVLVALFNRPRWAVPPALRREPGMVDYAKTRPEQPFRDPRLPPSP
jgi:hypothetical protein